MVCGIWLSLSIFIFWYGIKRTRRRELAEIDRFENQPRKTDEAFLEDLEIDTNSPFAKPALAVRDAIAELATISPESLDSSIRISSDLNRLPYFDSPDLLGVLLEIEM
jgi:hypothetical protein